MRKQGTLFPLPGEVSAKPTKGVFAAVRAPSGASRHLPQWGRSG
jgi:hypothetical protein